MIKENSDLTEHPLPLSDVDVRAIIEWRKTQHRVVLQPAVPPYSVGDRLWVQEAWTDVSTDNGPALIYRSDYQFRFIKDETQLAKYPGCSFSIWNGDALQDSRWHEASGMPRLASRLLLEITDVRMQQLQDITWPDAVYEGMAPPENCYSLGPETDRPRDDFQSAWRSIHGADAWEANPLVVALTFRIVRAPAFAEIWERKMRWPKGPALLTDIVLFLRQHYLTPERDPDDPARAQITVPLPEVMNAQPGKRTDVISLIPDGLRDIFDERCRRIVERRAFVVAQATAQFLSKGITDRGLGLVYSFLANHERELGQRGEAQLWQVAAEEFGLAWNALPKPAGLVRQR